MTSNEQKNFGLTEDAFAELRDKLNQGDQSLFEHVFLAHFKDCMAYVMREDGAAEDIAYDATMDAFLAFRDGVARRKISYGNLRFLLTRMARQYYYKKTKKEATSSLEDLKDLPVQPDVVLEESLLGLLEKAWKFLGEECKQLLRAFYHQGQSFKEIAIAKKRKEAALRKQKQRCIETLRTEALK